MTGTAWPPRVSPSAIALSVVVPVYNEIENVPRLASELLAVVDHPAVEVILVDDGSTDGTLEAARRFDRFRLLGLPRSGKSEALRRGFAVARGEWILTLDGDLQEDPADIPAFWESREEVDALVGVRSPRRDPILGKRIPSVLFNAAVGFVLGVSLRDGNCGFRLLRKSALAEIGWFRGAHRFLPVLIALQGGRVVERRVRHRARQAGRSKFSSPGRGLEAFAGLVHLFLDSRRRSKGGGSRGR